MKLICVHCKTEGDHWVDWTLDGKSEVATVRTKCQTCSAAGAATANIKIYDAAFNRNASAAEIIQVIRVIKCAVDSAELAP